MDHLPTETLLPIFKGCTDLSTLYSLINTSRRLSAIFDNHAAEILDTVLTSVVPDPTHRLMRIILYIRAGEFKHRKWADRETHPLPLDDLPPPLLRKGVHLAHRVHVLAHLCLERCLQRCRALGKVDGLPPWIEPPSWIEEQRAIIAFWRVQYFYELKIGRLKGRLNWGVGGLSALQSSTIEGEFSGFLRERVMTAADFIDEIRAEEGISNLGPPSSLASSFRLPDLGDREVVDPSWRCGVADWRMNLMEPVLSRPCTRSQAVQEPMTLWLNPPWTRRSTAELEAEPMAWIRLRSFDDLPRTETPQLRRLPFQPYRKFGLFFWGEEKINKLGLWPNRYNTEVNKGRDYFPRWLSLLTPDELAWVIEGDEENGW